MPIYFIVLTAVGVLLGSGCILKHQLAGITKDLVSLPALTTFTMNNGGAYALNHFWSVSIEEQFYCCLPIVLLLFRTYTYRLLLAAALAVMLPLSVHPDVHVGILGNIAFFPLVVGALLALLQQRMQEPPLKLVLLLAAIALLGYSKISGTNPYGPEAVCSFAILVWLASTRRYNLRLLQPLAYIGRISYCVYLVHVPIILLTSFALSRFGFSGNISFELPAAAATSIAIAALSWQFLEKPILGCRDRLRKSRWRFAVAFLSPVLIIAGLAYKAISSLR